MIDQQKLYEIWVYLQAEPLFGLHLQLDLILLRIIFTEDQIYFRS